MRGASRPLLLALLLVLVPLAGCAAPGPAPGKEEAGGEGLAPQERPGDAEGEAPVREASGSSAAAAPPEAVPLQVRLYATTALEDARDLQTFVARVKGHPGNLTYRWTYIPHTKPLAGAGPRDVGMDAARVDFRFPMDGLYTLSVEVRENATGRFATDVVPLRVGKVPEDERIPVFGEWSGRIGTGGVDANPDPERIHLVGPSDLIVTLTWTSATPGSVVRAVVTQGGPGGMALATAQPTSILDGRTAASREFAAYPGNITVRVEAERGLDVAYTVRIEGLSDPVRPVVPYEAEDEAAANGDDGHGHAH